MSASEIYTAREKYHALIRIKRSGGINDVLVVDGRASFDIIFPPFDDFLDFEGKIYLLHFHNSIYM